MRSPHSVSAHLAKHLIGAVFLLCCTAAQADLTASFNAAADVPLITSSYTASGNATFTLNFAPEPGTNLTVVKNTGLPFIQSSFNNLANGAAVNLSFNGTTYPFVAWYYGGEGNNDLVLLWRYTGLTAWGWNDSGQLGDKTYAQRNAPVAVDQGGELAGKTIVQVLALNDASFALTSEGKVYSWGSNNYGILGDNTVYIRKTAPVAVNVDAGTSSLFAKTVVALAGGSLHCLALCSDGTVAAWGINTNGQLGDNTNMQRMAPVAVNTTSGISALSGKTVVRIAAGNSHSLVLCSDGTLAAWGLNSSGQLGSNTTTNSSVPMLVNADDGTSALFGKTVTSIESAASHNLALCSDGTLAAWGSNTSGQLGDNTTAQQLVPVTVNTDSGTSALFGKSVAMIAAGGSSSLALCSDGTLTSWGSNTNGQLGDNSTTQRLVPVTVNTDSGMSALHGKSVRGIAAGRTSSQVLCSDGTLAAWGNNTYGQLGDNTTIQRLVPVAVNTSDGVSVLAGSKVGQIDAANSSLYHYLAVYGAVSESVSLQGNGVEITRQDATPSAADHTNFGQANLHGVAIVRTFNIISHGFFPLNLTGIPKVAVTGVHTADFSVTSQPSSPLALKGSTSFQVTFDPTATGVRSALLSISNDTADSNPFTFAIQGTSEDPEITMEQPTGIELNTGGVRNFGEVIPGNSSDLAFVIRNTGGSGSLLNGVNVTLSGANAGEFSITGSPVTTLVGPDGSTSFVVRFTPTLSGGTRTAMLSIASNDTDENPYQIQLTGSVATSISASFNTGSDVGLILGGLKATGMTVNLVLNFAPVPGTNLTVVRNTGPLLIEGAFTNLPNGATVNLNYEGTLHPFVVWYYGGEGSNDLVLLWPRTGLAAWGLNSSGQIGDGTTLQRHVPVMVDQSGVLLGKTIVQVARGNDYVLALTSEGQVFSWGNDVSGQLGNAGWNTYYMLPVPVSTSGALSGKTVVAIAAGYSHNLALCSDGTVVAWGSGSQGQIGTGSTYGVVSVPEAVSRYSGAGSVLSGKSVVAIAAGGQHSLALCSDGTLAAWGGNQKGQLGDNTTSQQNYPRAVSTANGTSALFGRTITAISAGSDYSLALCSDGKVVAWGGNAYGQLGVTTTVDSKLPVLVSTTETESAFFGRAVVSIMACGNHSRALCSDGSMVAWGHNQAGSLGDGTATDRYAPVVVNPLGGGGVLQGRNIVTFTSNQALCSDGTLAAWGYNLNGQVGDDTTTDRLAPVAVNTASGMSALAGGKVSGLGGPGLPTSPSVAVYGRTLVSKIGLSGNATFIADVIS